MWIHRIDWISSVASLSCNKNASGSALPLSSRAARPLGSNKFGVQKWSWKNKYNWGYLALPYIKRHGRWSGMAATKYAFDCSHLLHKLRARGSGSGRAAFSGKAVFSGMAADSFAAWPLTQLRRGRCERHGRWTHSRQRRCTMERQCRLRAAMWPLA